MNFINSFGEDAGNQLRQSGFSGDAKRFDKMVDGGEIKFSKSKRWLNGWPLHSIEAWKAFHRACYSIRIWADEKDGSSRKQRSEFPFNNREKNSRIEKKQRVDH